MEHEFASKVLIHINGGLIDVVEKGENVILEIRDYDVDFIDEDDIMYDAEGRRYIERYNE